jgi:hypothetical protein
MSLPFTFEISRQDRFQGLLPNPYHSCNLVLVSSVIKKEVQFQNIHLMEYFICALRFSTEGF